MTDLIFTKMGNIFCGSGICEVGGFAVEEYAGKYNQQPETVNAKTLFGVIIENDDSIKSIHNMINVAVEAGASVLMFDIQEATGKQIMSIRSYIRLKHIKFEETSGLYETRICFMKP